MKHSWFIPKKTTLSISEYKEMKANEIVQQEQSQDTKAAEIVQQEQSQNAKAIPEEVDESLQVDYEESDSSPENKVESIQQDDSKKTTSSTEGSKPLKVAIPSEDKLVSSSTEGVLIPSEDRVKKEGEQAAAALASPYYYPSSPDSDEYKGLEERFSTHWPWHDDVKRYQRFAVLQKMGQSFSSYGLPGNIVDEPYDSSNISGWTSKHDPDRAFYYQSLFWKSKYFDGKHLSTDIKALSQSWDAFVKNYNDNPRGWHESLDRKVKALRQNKRSVKGLMYDIHCRTVEDLNMACGIRKRKCFFCPTGQRCMTDDEFNGYSTHKVPRELRELIIDFEKRFPLEERSTTTVRESSRTRGPYRGHPARGVASAPKSLMREDTQASGLGTHGSSHTGGAQCVDEIPVSQQSTGYSPGYQPEELEEGEEYDPGSAQFSPGKAYKFHSQRPETSVNTPSVPQSVSHETELLRLEKQLLEERYARSELQNRYQLTCHSLEKMDALLQKYVKKLDVLEGDHRRLLGQLVHENLLKKDSLLKKRKSVDISSDVQHKTSDADAST